MDAADQQGRAPLLLAASQPGQGHLACLELLLEAGADGTAADARGRTPAQLAVRRNDAAALRLLVWGRCEDDDDAASVSSSGNGSNGSSGSEASVDSGWGQGGRGAELDERDAAGRTLLHLAAAEGALSAAGQLAADA